MTATKKNEGVTLSPQQVQAAAQAGVQLIAEGRVNVPSDMAMNGTLGVLNAVLQTIATGQAILVSPSLIEELQKTPVAKPKATPRKKAPAKKKVSKKKTTKR